MFIVHVIKKKKRKSKTKTKTKKIVRSPQQGAGVNEQDSDGKTALCYILQQNF